MATINRLGPFALPNLATGKEATFLRDASRCIPPANEFSTTLLNGTPIIIEPATLPQSCYTEMSRERAMLWLWRIKQFTVSGTIEIVANDEETTYTLAIGPFVVANLKTNDLSAPIETEKEKACDCGMFFGQEQSEGYDTNEEGSHLVRVSIAAVQNVWSNYPTSPTTRVAGVGQRVRQDYTANLFYVPVFVELSVRTVGATFSYSSGNSSWLTDDPGYDKNIGWDITDSLGTIYRNFRFGNDQASGTINIEATEYWPYDPGDGGGPIYDSQTGQQLRAFP